MRHLLTVSAILLIFCVTMILIRRIDYGPVPRFDQRYRTAVDVPRTTSPTEQLVMVDSSSNWQTSLNESRWHLVYREGGSPTALCNHRLRGPVRRIISSTPPSTNDGRSHCPNCLQVAEDVTRSSEESTRRKLHIAASLDIAGPAIVWPTVDPDENEVPGSPNLPGTDWNLTVAA